MAEAAPIRTGSERDPDTLIAAAKERWAPLRTVCLFSAGTDSGVLSHRCREGYDDLLYIDTRHRDPGRRGAHPRVRPAARQAPLDPSIRGRLPEDGPRRRALVVAVPGRPGPPPPAVLHGGDALGGPSRRPHPREGFRRGPYGFPGKGQHSKAYSRIKERRLEEVLREVKSGHPRHSTVLFLSGIRRDESARRAAREPLNERGSAKFCSPLIAWTKAQMVAYQELHGLPVSDVAALMHLSGECNCGAFAHADEERRLISSLWPGWWAETIGTLEAEAAELGIRWCRWGGYDLAGVQAAGAAGRRAGLCSSCQDRSFEGASS